MVTFIMRGGSEQVNAFCRALRLFHFAESLGGAESLICHPTTMSHAVLSEEQRQAAGITYQMIRMSVGLEHADDLIGDLDRALNRAGSAN
jgi:cystathionine beta-lyase/cystathionine gamma-synthase